MGDNRLSVENTYQLGPEEPLTRLAIRPLVQKALQKQFLNWTYDAKTGASKSRDTCV